MKSQNSFQSLCFAKSKQNLAFAYSNRSAVYLELDLYEACVDNIRAARDNEYPLDKVYKLISRVDICIAKMPKVKRPSNTSLFFQPSYPVNPKIPHIVDCLEIREDQKFGRGVFTTRDLNPGDMLAVEDPVIARVSEGERYIRCSQCSNCNLLSLIPCPKTASFMFCSQDCYDTFINFFVNYPNEYFDFTQVGGYQFLKQFTVEHDISKLDKTIFDFDFSNKSDPDYLKNKMICLMSLANKLPFPKDFEDFKVIDEDNPRTQDFYNARTKILANCYRNNTTEYGKNGDRYLVNAGGMVYAFLPLINHACYSNVDNVIISNRSVLFVTKPIKAGDQLFYSYL